jgi:hypothetical protein
MHQALPGRGSRLGGPGRIRTSNQTVMSAVTLSETSIKSGVFRHASQRMFTIGCGQSLAKRWLDVHRTAICADGIPNGILAAGPSRVRCRRVGFRSATIRAAERWRSVKVTESERRQISAARKKLDEHARSTCFETWLADESAARSAPCGDHDLGEAEPR